MWCEKKQKQKHTNLGVLYYYYYFFSLSWLVKKKMFKGYLNDNYKIQTPCAGKKKENKIRNLFGKRYYNNRWAILKHNTLQLTVTKK